MSVPWVQQGIYTIMPLSYFAAKVSNNEREISDPVSETLSARVICA